MRPSGNGTPPLLPPAPGVRGGRATAGLQERSLGRRPRPSAVVLSRGVQEVLALSDATGKRRYGAIAAPIVSRGPSSHQG